MPAHQDPDNAGKRGGVQGKHPTGASICADECRDQETAEGGTHGPCQIVTRRVEGDRVRQLLLRHQLWHDRLPGRVVIAEPMFSRNVKQSSEIGETSPANVSTARIATEASIQYCQKIKIRRRS